jgi:DUF438 domain-containing protein
LEKRKIMDERKKTIVKDVIRQLHAGLRVEEAKERILREVGPLSSAEITGIEQSLIEEGVSPEEIKRFCNVHALLFEASLAQNLAPEGSEAHPLGILRGENEQIHRILNELKEALASADFPAALARVRAALGELKGVPRHYEIKENAIFPFLEKHGFSGPSQVMWAKHNDVRSLLREAEAGIAAMKAPADLAALGRSVIDKLVEEVEGMLSGEELVAILNSLPVDVSFVDAEGKVRYFNQSGERIFPRSVSVIGRSVQNCHPPQSVHKVNAILESFRKNESQSAEFWITLGGRFVSIRYFAVRGAGSRNLECLEVTQDLTALRAREGERRLLDDGKKSRNG